MSIPTKRVRPRLADLAFVTYLAPLFNGRRVAVVGSTSGDLARRVRLLGAHTVVSFGGVGEDLAVRALTPGALASFHGRLDVILVPDASAVPSLVAVLDEARRALGSDGLVALGADPQDSPRPLESFDRSGPDYSSLVSLCTERFAEVRVAGRGPFVGYQLAALDEPATGVSLDTRLIDGDPPRPEGFIALASDSPIALDPLAVVQIPETVLDALRDGATAELDAQLKDKDQKLKDLEQASAERWVKLQRLEHGVKELEDENRKSRDKVVRLSKDLEDERKLRQRIELDQKMVRAVPELPRAPDPELARLREALSRAESERDTARVELTSVRSAQQTAADAQTAALTELNLRLSASEAAVVVAQGELDKLHTALASADTHVRALELELDETQQSEAALVAELGESSPRGTVREGELARQLESEREARMGLETEYQRLESELHRVSTELRRTEAARATAAEAVLELARSTQLRRSETDLAALRTAQGENATLRSQRDGLVSRVELLEKQLVDAVGAIQQLTWRGDELVAELAARPAIVELAPSPTVMMVRDDRDDARIAGALRGMTSRARELEQQVIELDRALAQSEKVREGLVHEVSLARDDAAKTVALNVGLEARVVRGAMELEGARSGYNRRVVELEHEVDKLLKAVEIAGQQASYENEEMLRVRIEELSLVRANAQGMQYRLDELERAVAVTNGVGKVAEADRARAESIAAARARIEALTTERDALGDKLDAVTAERDALAQEVAMGGDGVTDGARVEGVLADLSVTAERLARTEEKLDALRGALDAARGGISAMLADGRGALVAPELMSILRESDVSVG